MRYVANERKTDHERHTHIEQCQDRRLKEPADQARVESGREK